MNGIDSPIFIVGIRRSGSTLWRRILEKNGDLAVYGEMQFLWPWEKDFPFFLRKYVGNLSIDENIKRMVDFIFSDHPPKIRLLELRWGFWETLRKNNDEELKEAIIKRITESNRSIESVFKAITEETTKHLGFQRYMIKFPVYFNHVHTLLEWYPKSKIVHITRDPKAISMSKKNDPGGTARLKSKYPYLSYLLEKAMTLFVVYQYNWSARVHNAYKSNSNYALFHYENLLLDPEKTIKELCEFTGLTYNKEMLFPSKGRFSSIDGKRRSGIDKKSGIRWKKKITPFEKKFITFCTKKSMEKLEYDPTTHLIFRGGQNTLNDTLRGV